MTSAVYHGRKALNHANKKKLEKDLKFFSRIMPPKDVDRMANLADPGQTLFLNFKLCSCLSV